MARAVGSVLIAVALLAAGLARMRRVERPVFALAATSPDGSMQLGRVRLARRGETGRVLGWTARCAGREVWSRLGERPEVILRVDHGSVSVAEAGASGRSLRRVVCPAVERAADARRNLYEQPISPPGHSVAGTGLDPRSEMARLPPSSKDDTALGPPGR